jgi:hypothetical protein
VSQAVAQRADRLDDFLLGEAWDDVLLAIPVKGLQAQPKDTFELGPVSRHGNQSRQVRFIIKRKRFDVGVDLKPRPVR